MPLDLWFIVIWRVSPIKEYENCFQKWIDRLKSCIQVDGEYFEGQSNSKWF